MYLKLCQTDRYIEIEGVIDNFFGYKIIDKFNLM